MGEVKLEHVNMTLRDPLATAAILSKLFDWHIRWQGDSTQGGFSVHVGAESTYLALYARGEPPVESGDTYGQINGLNHLGVVVTGLDEIERRVIAAGFKTYFHDDYEPGKRFYFEDKEGLEIEVVCYE